jgi:hypothetical protein
MMKDHRMPPSYSNIVRLLRDVMERVGALTCLWPHALVPVPVRCRPGWDTGRRRPSPSTVWLPLLAGFILLAAVPAWAGAPALPAGVPNLLDPTVRAHFQRVTVANLQDNPDFPVVLLVNTTGEEPRVLLLGLDARNGKDTFSLSTDPIILIMVLAGPATIQNVYVDIGFADSGMASGSYAAVDPENAAALPELLRAVPATGTIVACTGAAAPQGGCAPEVAFEEW